MGSTSVSEYTLGAGWYASWTLNGSPVTPFNPDLPENLGKLCYTMGPIGAGGTANFAINNYFPNGTPRTIGYWSNWVKGCASGNQPAVAAKNGFYLLWDVLPQMIGNLQIDQADECTEGVPILKKRDVVTGRNMANDAAYGLAAQLLAAKANIAAQAYRCDAATQAIADAQALLVSINFTGTGSYLGPNSGNASQRNLALQLAMLLDQYNNGTLCVVLPTP